jgi:hypothetical protein
MWSRRAAAVQLLLAALLLAGGGSNTAAAPDATSPVVPADSFLNANGLPLLMPTNRTTDGRRWLFELPRDPVGTLVMLHRCGRNAEDFWPPSVRIGAGRRMAECAWHCCS